MAATSSFRYYPRINWTSRVTGAKIQGSLDQISWTDLATISVEPPNNAWSVVNMDVDLTTYNFVRYLSPNSGYGNIAEVEWYDGTYGSGGVKLEPSAYISSPNSGNPFSNAFDGDVNSFFEGQSGDGQYVGIDIREPEPPVASVRFYPRPGWASRMFNGYFEASNDMSSWTLINIITATPTESWNVLDSSTDLATYRYMRYVSPDGSWANVAEIEFYKNNTYANGGVKVTGTLFSTPEGYIGYGGGGTNTFVNAFDGDTGTYVDLDESKGAKFGIDVGEAPAGGKVKFYYGASAWLERPVKYWTGSAWVEKPIKYWTGTEWKATEEGTGPPPIFEA